MASKRAADISQRILKKNIKDEIEAEASLKKIKEEVDAEAKPYFAKERAFDYKVEERRQPPMHDLNFKKVEIQPRWKGPIDKKHGYPIDPDARRSAIAQMKLVNALDLPTLPSQRGQISHTWDISRGQSKDLACLTTRGWDAISGMPIDGTAAESSSSSSLSEWQRDRLPVWLHGEMFFKTSHIKKEEKDDEMMPKTNSSSSMKKEESEDEMM